MPKKSEIHLDAEPAWGGVGTGLPASLSFSKLEELQSLASEAPSHPV